MMQGAFWYPFCARTLVAHLRRPCQSAVLSSRFYFGEPTAVLPEAHRCFSQDRRTRRW
jgi:hypothetical protein